MRHTRSGFTIIELITVVTITAIISIVSVSVLVNSQVRGTKSTTINKVRNEGAFLLDRISFLLRNARYIEENQFGATCQPAMESIRVRQMMAASWSSTAPKTTVLPLIRERRLPIHLPRICRVQAYVLILWCSRASKQRNRLVPLLMFV